jgi:hypothetical protein
MMRFEFSVRSSTPQGRISGRDGQHRAQGILWVGNVRASLCDQFANWREETLAPRLGGNGMSSRCIPARPALLTRLGSRSASPEQRHFRVRSVLVFRVPPPPGRRSLWLWVFFFLSQKPFYLIAMAFAPPPPPPLQTSNTRGCPCVFVLPPALP